MYRITVLLIAALLTLVPIATPTAHAAAGIFASGGGSVTAGERFTITVKASGTTFDSLQGNISVSGPVEIVSFSPGSATWLPGKTPGNGQQFVGLTSPTNDLVVARVTLRGTKEGSGAVSVSGVKLASKGQVVASDAGGANFTIKRAPVLPGQIKVSSPSHPDQNQAYENNNIELTWDKPSGVTEFSYFLDQDPNTTPSTKADGSNTSVTYENKEIGTYYFHIRGKNGDGWGAATHFKITIKEPDPKINDTLAKPIIRKFSKTTDFITNLSDGTLTGIVASGTAQPDFDLKLTFTPSPGELPAEAYIVKADATGAWQLTFTQPLKAGFYVVTAQSQQDKTLSPVSDPVRLELSLAKGGNVQFITEKDAVPTPMPSPTPSPAAVKGSKGNNLVLLWAGLFAIVATGTVGWVVRARRRS